MILGFQILAVVFGGTAAYFLWTDNKEAAFVTAVLAACSFFLSIRFQARARLDESAERRNENVETDDGD